MFRSKKSNKRRLTTSTSLGYPWVYLLHNHTAYSVYRCSLHLLLCLSHKISGKELMNMTTQPKTGNSIVDAVSTLNITGNITPSHIPRNYTMPITCSAATNNSWRNSTFLASKHTMPCNARKPWRHSTPLPNSPHQMRNPFKCNVHRACP